MSHCATQATPKSPVYWWDEQTRHWEQVKEHPTPGRFAFTNDQDWILPLAESLGWLAPS
jgi:hypothetical protein